MLAEEYASTRAIKEQRAVYNVETGIVKEDGNIIWTNVSAVPVAFPDWKVVIVTSDITERKRSEEALKESEEKFSKAFSASGNAICITSLKDNLFMEINDSFTRFTGYSHEEVIGHSASELKLWVKPEELKRWMDTIQKEGRVFNQEFSSLRKSGEIRIGLASAEVINIRGEPCRIVVITDITERKQSEEKLKYTLFNLEQSSARLEATNKELEAFSYSVSHDLRSPLRSIDGFSQALLEDYPDKLDATGQDYLKRVRNASQKMGELIDGLLKLSRQWRPPAAEGIAGKPARQRLEVYR
jgi:PAS domain S-box-containing protein